MLVPIKILLDEAKKPFVPYVPSNSIVIQGTDKTVEDALNERYTKTETDELVNTGDTNTLNSAKAYTDDSLANFEGGITEAQVDEKINTAKTDLTSAYSASDTTTLNSAKSYTDSKFNDAGSVVVNPIVTIKEALELQVVGETIRLYNSALKDVSDGKMFTVTFPESDTTYTDLQIYYAQWYGGGAGWKITNVHDYSLLSGQTCIIQARVADSDYTFTVVDVLTSTESVKKNLKDVLVTTCEATNMQHVAQTYYVYDEALRNPRHNQLFIITVPELGVTDETVYFYYTAQSGYYTGYLLTNIKSEEVSNQKLLIQAKVVEDTTTFELVSILPTRNLILNKIDDYLITTCEATNTNMQYVGQTYYVYNLRLRNPARNKLFIITIPELTEANKDVNFWYTSQSGYMQGYTLTNAKSNDISNQKILIQAKISEENVTTFDVVGIISAVSTETVLYSHPTGIFGNFYLSSSISNFKCIEIFYRSSSLDHNSIRILINKDTASSFYFELSSTYFINNTAMGISTVQYDINPRTNLVSRVRKYGIKIEDGVVTHLPDSEILNYKIYKVVGYK